MFLTVTGVNCTSQQFWPPYATAAGLLRARAPEICSHADGSWSGTARIQLFAPATGTVVWQAGYPVSQNAPVSNANLVALALPGGQAEVRAYASGRVVPGFRLPPPARVVFATARSIVAASCRPVAGSPCVPHLLGLSLAGTPHGGTRMPMGVQAPFAAAQGRLYGYGPDGRHVAVYRLVAKDRPVA